MKTKTRTLKSIANDTPGPSSAVLHPHMRLASAVLVKAIEDYCDGDPLTRLDSFYWLLGDGEVFLDCLGIDADLDAWLVELAADKDKRRKLIGRLKRRWAQKTK